MRMLFLLLCAVLLSGCYIPYAGLELRSNTYGVGETGIVKPHAPEIQSVLTLVSSVLKRHGYRPLTERTTRGTTKGWIIEEYYLHQRPYVSVRVYVVANNGSEQPSVTVSVGFQEGMKLTKVRSQTRKVRDEIAEELVIRFGKDKVILREF